MLDQVKENLGQVAEQTVADAGYQATTEFAVAEEKSYPILVNLPEPKEDQPYHASRFVYDVEKDHCVCPRLLRGIFLVVASTPPSKGGEYAWPKHRPPL